MDLFFRNEQIRIYRKRRIGSTHRYSLSATGTVWGADIQPASLTRQQSLPEHFGHLYTGFVDVDCDVKENDKIHVEDSKVYLVKGVEIWRGAGLLDHKMLTLVSQDA